MAEQPQPAAVVVAFRASRHISSRHEEYPVRCPAGTSDNGVPAVNKGVMEYEYPSRDVDSGDLRASEFVLGGTDRGNSELDVCSLGVGNTIW